MKKLPCPRCGNPDVIDTFCADCQRELHPLVEKVKDATITFCVVSGKVKIGTGWENISPQEAVQKAVEKSLTVQDGATVTTREFDFEDLLRKPGINRTIDIETTVEKGYTEEYIIPITLKTTVSPTYAKLGTNYFEATIQLRNEKPEHKKLLFKLMEKFDGMASNKEIAHENGTDYLTTNKQATKKIAYKLQERFGGVIKENVRLITRDHLRSKDVYRLTMFLEFPPYEKGVVLTDGTRLLQFQSASKKLRFRNILTGKKVEEGYEQDKFTVVEQQKTRVTQVEPELQILHPETYQQVRAIGEAALDEEVLVVRFQKKWYLTALCNPQ